MAKPLRIEYPGSYYHVMNRGNRQENIFKSDYHRKSSTWKKEQDEILRKLEQHQNTNRSYPDDGVKLLDLEGWADPSRLPPTI